MNYREYCEQLLELQTPTGVQKPTNFRYYAAISFGFVEELAEFLSATSGDGDMLKEAGDVLAYCTLLIMSRELGYQSIPNDERTITNTVAIFESNDNYTLSVDINDYPGYFSGKFKRYFRENANVSVIDITAATIEIINSSGFSFSDVAQANIDKLSSRFARGVMHGSGDNR